MLPNGWRRVSAQYIEHESGAFIRRAHVKAGFCYSCWSRPGVLQPPHDDYPVPTREFRGRYDSLEDACRAATEGA